MPASHCAFPACPRPAVALGLCAAHYRQQQRGGPLRPLRGPRGRLGEEALERVSLRVAPRVAGAVRSDPPGARAALDAWARRRT